MDSFRFMASMAADSAFETFSSTQERAKELAAAGAASLHTASTDGFTTVAGGLTSGVTSFRAKAATASESVASFDLSKLEAGTFFSSSLTPTRDSAQGAVSSVGMGASGVGPGSRPTKDLKASDEDSESGGEDGGRGGTFFSRIGLQAPYRGEKQTLLSGGANGRCNPTRARHR